MQDSTKAVKRQFAPEFSQDAYKAMLKQEFHIGDYTAHPNAPQELSEEARGHMVTLLEELNFLKRYKEETLYLALSIADRYLVRVTVAQTVPPCLITLAVVATLIAAKIEQPISPSFIRMAHLVKEEWGVEISKKELIDLEDRVLLTLDFELHHVSPLPFLDRFLRLYGLDLSPNQAECAP